MNKIKRNKIDSINQNGMYFTHDNGGKPFAVKLVGKTVFVFETKYNEKSKRYDLYVIGKIPVKNKTDLMIGIDNEYNFNGNSVLIRIKNDKYIFIGNNIYELKTTDKILKYFSPVGNSDIPYPYAVGEKYTYLLGEGSKIENSYLKSFSPKDKKFVPYTYLYGWDGAHARKDGVSTFTYKLLVHRRWNLPEFIK